MPQFRYFRPASLAWWAGVGMIFVGVWAMFMPQAGWLDQISLLVGLLTGITDPATGAGPVPAILIFNGLGFIGIRDKLHRALVEGRP